MKKKEIALLIKNLSWLNNDLIETTSKKDAQKICGNIKTVADLLSRVAQDSAPQSRLEHLKSLRK